MAPIDERIASFDTLAPLNYVKIAIEVCDTGVGIKKENLSKLFMDFSRLDEHAKMNA